MSRNIYDDIIERQNRARRKNGMSRLLIAVILLALLICGITFLLFMNDIKKEAEPLQPAGEASPLITPDEALPETVRPSVITPVPVIRESTPQEIQIQTTPVAVSLESVSTLRESQMQKVEFTNQTVREGETAASVARACGLNPSTVYSVNGLTGEVAPGDVLLIPSTDGTVFTDASGQKIFIPSGN